MRIGGLRKTAFAEAESTAFCKSVANYTGVSADRVKVVSVTAVAASSETDAGIRLVFIISQSNGGSKQSQSKQNELAAAKERIVELRRDPSAVSEFEAVLSAQLQQTDRVTYASVSLSVVVTQLPEDLYSEVDVDDGSSDSKGGNSTFGEGAEDTF